MPRARYRRNNLAYKPTIREAVQANLARPEAERETAPELAKRLGVRVASIYVCMSNLRRAGVIDPRPGALPPPGALTNLAVVDPAAAAQRLLEQSIGSSRMADIGEKQKRKGVMAKEERARRLSHIGRYGAANSAVLAIQKLNEMEDRTGLNVGPGPPLSHEAKVQRLVWVLVGAGKEVTREAVAAAFPNGLDVEMAVGDIAVVETDQGLVRGASDGAGKADRGADGGTQAT